MATPAAPRSPRRSSGRPRGADSAARREEIPAAAARLFSQEGCRGTSRSGLARAAGMSQTGLVHCFPTKDGLQIQWLSDPDHPDMATDFQVLPDAPRGRWER
ncbi:TetR/AcrR family transcriptional regulator [Kocuria rosea]|uniref:TetR/AcrR family transcriptional regulator n=1 Tax=Kocuria rosea TaxID=1275 RepID=UPI002041FAD1|nr:helix-turn-helix domain-containing protein [Kocuria rosea]MCM3686994.1 TetR/AcrR family transcriptional regulator [Kocuria rosea]